MYLRYRSRYAIIKKECFEDFYIDIFKHLWLYILWLYIRNVLLYIEQVCLCNCGQLIVFRWRMFADCLSVFSEELYLLILHYLFGLPPVHKRRVFAYVLGPMHMQQRSWNSYRIYRMIIAVYALKLICLERAYRVKWNTGGIKQRIAVSAQVFQIYNSILKKNEIIDCCCFNSLRRRKYMKFIWNPS